MAPTTDRNAERLRRDIGIFGASFLALNAMIGAGIFALPGKIAVNAGLLSPWLFLVVGALFISVVLTFAEEDVVAGVRTPQPISKASSGVTKRCRREASHPA